MRLMLPAAAFLLIAAAPPPAPVETVVDDYYGTKVADDYRWMESGKDPRWMPWLKAQADYSRAVLDAVPGRAALFRDIQALTGDVAATSMVRTAGGKLFVQRRDKGAEDPRLYLREPGKPEQLLLDPETVLGPGQAQALDWWTPSPDGTRIALGLSKRGSEASVLHVLDVASGKLLADRIAKTDYGVVSWLPDSSGFAYMGFVGEQGTPSYYLNNEMRLHRLGASGPDRVLIDRKNPPIPLKPDQFGYLMFDERSPFTMLAVNDGRRESAIYIAPTSDVVAGRAQWKLAGDFAEQIEQGGMRGDKAWLVSTKDDPNGRLMITDAAEPDLTRARIINLPGNPVINALWNSKQGAWLLTVEGRSSGLWQVRDDGAAKQIKLPFTGSASVLSTNRDDGSAFVAVNGFLRASDIYHVTPGGELHAMGMGVTPSGYDASRYEERALTATARDGTKVPYTVVAKKGVIGNGPAPLLLDAYGSYGLANLPSFQAARIPFLDRGGVYVLANVRGGGEYGKRWHYAGRAATKANTWQDAIDVAETLVRDKLTTPAKMTLLGTSAGGIMVGQAVNARPDLFAGAIANVGFMNPIRYVSEQNMTDIPEWGGPITDAATFKTMFDMDPYEHVKKGVRYPATLVISGLNDPRAATFHSAKYAARMAASTSSGKPVLLRIDFGAGHGLGSTRTQRDAMWADVYSFALANGGAPGFALPRE